MLTRLLLSMAAVVSSAADECSAPTGQLAGRLVVITGASRGVGAELARTFASEGALVVVNYYKSKDKADAVVHEINHHRERHRRSDRPQALAVYGDVRVKADMDGCGRAARAHGRVFANDGRGLRIRRRSDAPPQDDDRRRLREGVCILRRGGVRRRDRPEPLRRRRADDALNVAAESVLGK